MVDESRNWQWNHSHGHGPDELNKEKLENQTGKQGENTREILQDIPETRNLGSMVMKCLESKRTNRSSGSLDEAQEHSIEKNLKTKWLSFSASLAAIPTNQAQRRFFNENKDPILDQWIFDHPHDHQFRLWQRSLKEWLAKYPEERPRKTK